ncbi:MAG: hypothetical protein KDB14_24625 [Planctomycetales bacterium]|nr:hypothetical protein [Planctomycetales bacterium]
MVVLIDGQQSLWDTVGMYLEFNARTVPILDILHVASYIWSAAKLFEQDEGTRKQFTRLRLARILNGEVHTVIRGLRQLATRRQLKGDPRQQLEQLEQICSYFAKNAERMRYREYLALGYPIASGAVEGACGHLAKDRMERSGMRWTLEGARAMLDVRAAFQSDHWRHFPEWRAEKEVANAHLHRSLVSGYTPAISL